MQNDVITVWNPHTGEVVIKRKPVRTSVSGYAYSGRDGTRLVIAEASGVITLLDATTLRPVGTPVKVGKPVGMVTASPDGRTALVFTGGQSIATDLSSPSTGWALVDLEAGRIVRTGGFEIANPETPPVYSPDGRHVAIGSAQGEVQILDTETGLAVRPPVKVHQGSTWGVAYSADGSHLVSAGYDGTVSLFDSNTAALLGSVTIPSRAIVTAEFQPDGYTVLIASLEDGFYRWDIRLNRAISHACQAAGRELTAEEWQQNFDPRPYRKVCP
jgi:WD40 repeat protein